MAKAVKILVKMESTANTGTFYVAEKNPRTHPEKMSMKKYDKKARKHVEFVEKKIDWYLGLKTAVAISDATTEVAFCD